MTELVLRGADRKTLGPLLGAHRVKLIKEGMSSEFLAERTLRMPSDTFARTCLFERIYDWFSY